MNPGLTTRRGRLHRRLALLTGGVALAVVATACPAPPPYAGPPTGNRTFQATSVTVNSTNDGFSLLCFCTRDEPKVLNIGFRVKLGVAGSASAQVIAGANHWNGIFEQGLSAGQSFGYQGAERGALTFDNVALPDIGDLAQGAPLELAGVWAWKLEDDGILAVNVNQVAAAIATSLTVALNATVALSQLPSDSERIVSIILAAVGSISFFTLFTTTVTGLLNNLNVLTDDVVGSAMYIGVGSSGTLASIIDGALGSTPFPAINISGLTVPPDVGGGAVFSLGTGTKTFTNSFTNGGVDGQHTTSYSFG